MTEPPQSHDGPPSVAALAVRLDRIRRDVESLTAKVDALTTTQQAHAAVIDDVAQLRRQVHQILTVLTAEEERSPAAWFWLTMTDRGTPRQAQRTPRLGRVRAPQAIPRLPRRPNPPLLAQPPRSQMGTGLPLPALVRRLPSRPPHTQRRRRLARPLVPWRHSPSYRRHEPMRGRVRPYAQHEYRRRSTSAISAVTHQEP